MEWQAERIEQLTQAVAHRTVIGMALGMLMERFGLDHDGAFARLRQCSQDENRKLYDIAVELTQTRQLPEATRRSRSA
jgi:AmiR/NasT family two-component response regulator